MKTKKARAFKIVSVLNRYLKMMQGFPILQQHRFEHMLHIITIKLHPIPGVMENCFNFAYPLVIFIIYLSWARVLWLESTLIYLRIYMFIH